MGPVIGQLDRAFFGCGEQVFIGLGRTLQEIGVFTQTSIGVNQFALQFVERHTVKDAGQRIPFVCHQSRLGVDIPLRFNADTAEPVSFRVKEALDLDVAHHLAPVALVCCQQRLVDPLALLAQIAMDGPFVIEMIHLGNLWVSSDGSIDQFLSLLSWNQEQRRIFQLAANDGTNIFSLEKSIGAAICTLIFFETDPACFARFEREDPVEPVHGTLWEGAVVRHGVHDRLNGRRFGGAIGPVKQDQSISDPVSSELSQLLIDRVLNPLLCNERLL